MAGKNIADMTDAEIDALSEAELLELQNGEAAESDDEPGEEEEEEESEETGDSEAGEEEEEEIAEEEEAAAEEGPADEIDQERLEQLLAADDDDDVQPDEHGMVPYSRFKKKVGDERDWKQIAKALLKREPEAAPVVKVVEQEAEPEIPTYDFKAKMSEYHKLVVAGKEDEAGTLLEEIEDKRAEVQAAQMAAMERRARESALATVERAEVQLSVKKAERTVLKEFPFLDPKHKTADADAILTVNAKARQLITEGKPAGEALLLAGRSIGKKFAKLLTPEASSAAPKLGADGKPLPTKKQPTGTPPTGTDLRTREGLKRNLKLQQPATLSAGKGNADKSVMKRDWTKMTDAEIAKLPPEELEAAMMGQTG